MLHFLALTIPNYLQGPLLPGIILAAMALMAIIGMAGLGLRGALRGRRLVQLQTRRLRESKTKILAQIDSLLTVVPTPKVCCAAILLMNDDLGALDNAIALELEVLANPLRFVKARTYFDTDVGVEMHAVPGIPSDCFDLRD